MVLLQYTLAAATIHRRRLDVVSDSVVLVVGELLEGLSLGLLDQKRGEDAQEHEQGVDLEDVVEPWAGVLGGGSAGSEGSDGTLSDD